MLFFAYDVLVAGGCVLKARLVTSRGTGSDIEKYIFVMFDRNVFVVAKVVTHFFRRPNDPCSNEEAYVAIIA